MLETNSWQLQAITCECLQVVEICVHALHTPSRREAWAEIIQLLGSFTSGPEQTPSCSCHYTSPPRRTAAGRAAAPGKPTQQETPSYPHSSLLHWQRLGHQSGTRLLQLSDILHTFTGKSTAQASRRNRPWRPIGK
jgi:hypothetical protein